MASRLLPVAVFVLFWTLRAAHPAGDGRLILRITEDGVWFVNNEILSQAVLQAFYRVASVWNVTAFETFAFLACVGGACALWVTARGAQRHFGVPPMWSIGLYLSSAFFIYSCGHTEYYPLLLPVMLAYGFAGLNYLRAPHTPQPNPRFLEGSASIHGVTAWFVLGCAMHLAMLIALPSLLILPLLKGRRSDYRSVLALLLLLLPLFIIRDAPHWTGYPPAQLGSGSSYLRMFPEYGMEWRYAFFEWAHAYDWLYAWTLRSWLFWPIVVTGIGCLGGKSLRRSHRLFLLIYTLCFTLWTVLWHPDLGIRVDWDLFALEAAPCLLLALSYMPVLLRVNALRCLITIAVTASCFVQLSAVLNRAALPKPGYGSIAIESANPNSIHLTLDGRAKPLNIPRIRNGVYRARILNQTQRTTQRLRIVVYPNHVTHLSIEEN